MFDLGSRSSSPCNLHPWLKSQYGGCTSSTKCRGTVSQTCRAGSAAGVPARWFYPGCCTGWAAGLDSTKEDYTTVSYSPIHYVTGQLSPTYWQSWLVIVFVNQRNLVISQSLLFAALGHLACPSRSARPRKCLLT